MSGNTVALGGAANVDDPGFAADPEGGVFAAGTGKELLVDLPPQPQTKKMMIEDKKRASNFDITNEAPVKV
jgi:hypothetical protein